MISSTLAPPQLLFFYHIYIYIHTHRTLERSVMAVLSTRECTRMYMHSSECFEIMGGNGHRPQPVRPSLPYTHVKFPIFELRT